MDDVRAQVDRAATYAMTQSRNHAWESLGELGVATLGLLSIDNEEANAVAMQVVDHAIQTQTSAENLASDFIGAQTWDDVVTGWTGTGGYSSNIGPPLIGQSVLEVYDRTGDETYLRAARRQYEAFGGVARTADGGFATRREAVEVWIDAVFMIVPFLVRYGQLDDEPAAVDEAVNQLRVHAAHLRDPATGLYRHIWRETPDSYPDSGFWSRGMGWMLTGLIDGLILLDDHEAAPEIEQMFTELADAIIALQDGSGLWRNVIDDPLAPLEASCACMYAYAFQKGVDHGVLDADPFGAAAQTAFESARGFVGADGKLNRVALTPGGPGAPIGAGSHGQGWFLIAAGYLVN